MLIIAAQFTPPTTACMCVRVVFIFYETIPGEICCWDDNYGFASSQLTTTG